MSLRPRKQTYPSTKSQRTHHQNPNTDCIDSRIIVVLAHDDVAGTRFDRDPRGAAALQAREVIEDIDGDDEEDEDHQEDDGVGAEIDTGAGEVVFTVFAVAL